MQKKLISDVESQKQLERSLRYSPEKIQTVLEGIDANIYVADIRTHEILFMNKKMIQSYGRDMTGEKCWRVLRNKSEPCTDCHLDQLIDENEKPKGVYTWQDRNEITDEWFMKYDRAIEWTDGRMVKLQIATDITTLKKKEEEVRQSHKMDAIETLTGGIAHEFNNILGIIIGNVELAMDDIPTWNPAHTNLQEIRQAGLRARDVVRQLLSFSLKSEQKNELIDVVPIIKDSIKRLKATIPTTIEIKSTIPEHMGMIEANPSQIQRIIIDICNNAVQAMEKSGDTLELTISQIELKKESSPVYCAINPGQYIHIAVKDNGQGIDPEIQERIFDPYYTTKEVGKGTGMGLAVVLGIVKSMAGMISVNSTLGKGSTFNLFFPIAREKPIAESATTGELPRGTEKIFVVDDESSIVTMTKLMLERLGYRVEVSMNPNDALLLFQTKPKEFDAMIIDMIMPKMNGVDLAEKIKAIEKDIPIILCTGHSSLIDENKAKLLGIAAFIMKPIIKTEMAKIIRKVLDAR